MTANAWQVFDIFYESVGAELHKLNAVDEIRCGLVLSTWTPNTQTDVDWAVVNGDEHADGNGYTTGGFEVSATWVAAIGVLTFDTVDAEWTAAGGSIVARYAVLYNADAGGSNDLIAYCLLDNTDNDVTATDGNGFTVATHVDGVFTIAQ